MFPYWITFKVIIYYFRQITLKCYYTENSSRCAGGSKGNRAQIRHSEDLKSPKNLQKSKRTSRINYLRMTKCNSEGTIFAPCQMQQCFQTLFSCSFSFLSIHLFCIPNKHISCTFFESAKKVPKKLLNQIFVMTFIVSFSIFSASANSQNAKKCSNKALVHTKKSQRQ